MIIPLHRHKTYVVRHRINWPREELASVQKLIDYSMEFLSVMQLYRYTYMQLNIQYQTKIKKKKHRKYINLRRLNIRWKFVEYTQHAAISKQLQNYVHVELTRVLQVTVLLGERVRVFGTH